MARLTPTDTRSGAPFLKGERYSKRDDPEVLTDVVDDIVLDPMYGLYVARSSHRADTGMDLFVALWAAPPRIEVALGALSLGEVVIGDASQAVVTVANVGGVRTTTSMRSRIAGNR